MKLNTMIATIIMRENKASQDITGCSHPLRNSEACIAETKGPSSAHNIENSDDPKIIFARHSKILGKDRNVLTKIDKSTGLHAHLPWKR